MHLLSAVTSGPSVPSSRLHGTVQLQEAKMMQSRRQGCDMTEEAAARVLRILFHKTQKSKKSEETENSDQDSNKILEDSLQRLKEKFRYKIRKDKVIDKVN